MPSFEGRFADLRTRLETMGEPLECAHRHPQSGDLLRVTTRGLAVHDQASGTVRFTDGWRDWALTSAGIVA